MLTFTHHESSSTLSNCGIGIGSVYTGYRRGRWLKLTLKMPFNRGLGLFYQLKK